MNLHVFSGRFALLEPVSVPPRAIDVHELFLKDLESGEFLFAWSRG